MCKILETFWDIAPGPQTRRVHLPIGALVFHAISATVFRPSLGTPTKHWIDATGYVMVKTTYLFLYNVIANIS